MTKRLKSRWLAGALCSLIFCVSCLGPNHATGHVFVWNGDIENKWGREGAFILLLPIYVIFTIGDLLIFNSVYWWTGDNPISKPGSDGEATGIGKIDPEALPIVLAPASEEE